MKKKHIISILILALVIGVLWVLKNQDRSHNLEVAADFFQVRDTHEIDKIFVTDLNKVSITLERKSFYWMGNQKFRCDRNSVKNLFEPLTKMRIRAAVSDQDKNDIVKELATKSKKVEIYRNGVLDKTLFIGNATADGLGSYVYADVKGLERPYIVHIPGWDGNIGPRFFINLDAWRSKKVFSHAPVKVELMEVNYPNIPEQSFRLTLDEEGKVNAEGMNPEQPVIENLDDRLVKEVFMNSNKVYFEQYLKARQHSLRDSIMNVLPVHATVRIKVKGGEDKTLILKEKPQSEIHMIDDEEMPLEKYYAYFEDEDASSFGIIQSILTRKFLKKYTKFNKSI